MSSSHPPAVLGLLADPLRWRIVAELARSDRRVGELVELVGKPQNLVSYHLAELRRGGLVSSRRSAADGRDVYYRAELGTCRDLLAEAGDALHPGLALAPSTPPDGATPGRRRVRVLFLCTGNSARSQIAEALLRHLSGGRVEAASAGSQPKPLHPEAVRVMAERGIDISGHRSTSIDDVVGRRVDRVVTLCDKVREVCPELPGAPVAAHWSIPDPAVVEGPAAARAAAFDQVADDIEGRVALLLADLRTRQPEGARRG